jgi:hypothetical protein
LTEARGDEGVKPYFGEEGRGKTWIFFLDPDLKKTLMQGAQKEPIFFWERGKLVFFRTQIYSNGVRVVDFALRFILLTDIEV